MTFFAMNEIVVHRGPIRVLKGLSLQIEKGDIVSLIGANGAGADLPPELELVSEALERLAVRPGLEPDELESDFLAHLGVLDLVHAAHAAAAELLDDLIAACEGGPGCQLSDGSLKGLRYAQTMVLAEEAGYHTARRISGYQGCRNGRSGTCFP